MHIFAYHIHCNQSPWADAPPWAMELREMLRIVIEKEATLMIDYTKLQVDITAQNTVLKGIVIGVQGLNASNAAQAQQIADLKAALAAATVTDPTVQAAVDALDQSVQDNTALVADLIPAVTTNTPTPQDEATAAASAAAQTPAG